MGKPNSESNLQYLLQSRLRVARSTGREATRASAPTAKPKRMLIFGFFKSYITLNT